MKSMTKMMVIAMVLVAALVVAPVAARAVTTNGTTVYVGEENLNLGGLATATAPDGTLVYYSSVSSATSATIGKTIAVPGLTFELTPSDVGSSTGAWYYFQTGNAGPLTNPQAANGYVLVQNPQVTLGVVLNNSLPTLESVDGKSVTRTTPIAFRLANNLNGFAPAGAPIKIDVTLPGGGVTTEFGGQSLDSGNLSVNGSILLVSSINLTNAESGTYTAQAKWPSSSDFYGKGFDSNAVTFEVLTKSLAITSNKDSVVRGNSFTVTITGESAKAYNLYIKDVSGLALNEYPSLVAGQSGVTPGQLGLGGLINATVTTNAAGTRTVQFNTNTTTDDRQYTLRVEDPNAATTTYDEVKVRVEEGDVTITASGTGVYYIGEEVTLSGTCTDNATTVHLFMTGPNLNSNGVNLDTIADVVNNNTASFTTTDVKADDTWSLKWNTGDIQRSLDAGGYTIYAVSKPLDKSKLSDANYATTSIQLRSGFITATSSGAVVAKGDDLTLTGTAQGDPSNVRVWIFGKNLQLTRESATVEDDGSFEYELKNTRDLTAGQYFVVIQHPMMNKVFDVDANSTGWLVGSPDSGFNPVNIRGLQASDAATALITALDSPNIDDTYVKLTFVVEEAQIFIDAIGDKAAGSKFTITGTTNLAVGDALNVEVTSAAFQPTSKTEASGFGSVAGVVNVQQGDGANTWSFEVDGASFKPDQYIVTVESIETDTTSTATFNVVEAVPTTQATPTTTGTAVTTPTTTTTTQATPTTTPGFGALLALAGLGAVAFLVLRRD